MQFIDSILDKITMYRLTLYSLIGILAVSFIFSFLHRLSFDPANLLLTVLILVGVCFITNMIFSNVFQAPTNIESVFITALILALIITPMSSFKDLVFLFWAGVWAMASKYIVAIRKSHLFNPAAFAVALTSFTISRSASWWVGTSSLLPFVVLAGFLIVRKIERWNLLYSFFFVFCLSLLGFSIIGGIDPFSSLSKTLFESPLIFFATVMLMEPLTSPGTKKMRMLYGGLVGFLNVPYVHIGSFYFTPEVALLAGNALTYLSDPRERLMLNLQEKIRIAPDVYDLVFFKKSKIAFSPGQYMEWTLPHPDTDSRGNRRFFTLASSPTEQNIRIGVKFYKNSSSFKHSLLMLGTNQNIIATQVSGDFVMPGDTKKQLVFVAGGIGVTPFRSMIKYMLDTGEKRPVTLLYSNRTVEDILYKDLFDEAAAKLGIKVVYTLTDPQTVPLGWTGKIGRIDEKFIEKQIPDYVRNLFYVSGLHAMVVSFEKALLRLRVPKNQIKIDFFPGYA